MVPLWIFFTSARAGFWLYRTQEELHDEYLIVEQCLADGFSSSRCRRRRCEWGRRFVGHCVRDLTAR